ncbi:2-dehydropantoate 2-reductase [Halobacillus rhizosphaerae]|uniref:2-dehydropantoate 2-reductase n=1 Tax=Halobacillus rhizosphaerae TaxID=3064889 RepID=UPI00398B2633
MNIGIIGAGAIGLLIAAHLGRNNSVHLYVRRKEQRDILNTHGVACDRAETVEVQAHLLSDGFLRHDVILVTVKQQQVDEILSSIKQLPAHVPVIFLQNGMGHLDKLSFLVNPVLVGTVEHGALKLSDRAVKHTGLGTITIAAYSDVEAAHLERLASWLSEPDFKVSSYQDYYELLVKKLMVNTVINPLTALFRVRNHALTSNPSIRTLGYELCKEAASVLDRSPETEWEEILRIAENTGGNYSSMVKDLMEKRTTEIDAINGYVAKKSQHKLPYHHFVIEAIHALEFANEREGKV